MKSRDLAAGLVALFLVTQFAFAEPKVDEKMVGPGMAQGVIYTVSPSGLHLGTVSRDGSRFIVTVDGVDGPKFDEIYNAAPVYDVQFNEKGFVIGQNITAMNPVAFSKDGNRHAYAARLGQELVVMVDGKEMYRGPVTNPTQPAVADLEFSPDGKRVFFFTPTTDTMQSFVLVMDGKPQFPANQVPYIRFSPDGSHYAYVITQPLKDEAPFLVIDGEKANYFGDRPQFSPDNHRVISVSTDAETNNQSLLVDGEPLITTRFVESVRFSSTGDIGAIVSTPDGAKKLFSINGKTVEGTENGWNFIFSPDGKRWALRCANAGANWIVLDGKPGAEYGQVSDCQFTADSSKCVYVGDVQGKKFVIVNSDEYEAGTIMRVPLTVTKTGGGYGYVAGDNLGDMKAYMNGMVYAPKTDIRLMELSPDGNRFGFLAHNDAFSATLFIDGKQQPATTGDMPFITFSQDSKHYLTWARHPQGEPALYIDDKFYPGMGGNRPLYMNFTADGQHVFWMIAEDNGKGEAVRHLYVDGENVAEFHRFDQALERKEYWEANADGSITVLASSFNPGQNTPGPMNRVTIAPSADLNAGKMLAKYEAQQAQAAEDAEKARIEAEAQAKQAQEDAAQAQQEAAAAKKKAYEEAAAAKKKAREDAAAAKKKAREDAAAKKKAGQ